MLVFEVMDDFQQLCSREGEPLSHVPAHVTGEAITGSFKSKGKAMSVLETSAKSVLFGGERFFRNTKSGASGVPDTAWVSRISEFDKGGSRWAVLVNEYPNGDTVSRFYTNSAREGFWLQVDRGSLADDRQLAGTGDFSLFGSLKQVRAAVVRSHLG